MDIESKNKWMLMSFNKLCWLGMAAAVLCAGCEAKQEEAAPGGFAVNVVGFKSRVEDIEEKISLVGTLEANESVEIKSEIDGLVEEILFKEGQKVSKDTILFRIDHRKLKSSLDQVQSNLTLAETTAKRYEQLIKTLAVSKQEYDRVMADLESARASLELAKEQFDDATIRASFDGTMGVRLVSVGQFVSKGTSLGFLVDTHLIKAAFHVPERYLGEVGLDQTISLTVAAYPEKMFKGEVFFIDPKINESTRTVLIKAEVLNPEGILRSGMFANLDLIVKTRPAAVVIPETAVMMNVEKTKVYVVDSDNKVHGREIKTGLRFDGFVEVTEGLAENEIVIIEGIQKVREDAEAKVRLDESAQTNP